MLRGIAAALIILGGLAGCTSIPTAVAVACDHREPGHVAKHGGQLEDDRFHLAHGERVTCSDDGKPAERHDEPHKADDQQRHDDDHRHRDNKWWRND